jgi:REP element-mobilizing transposase RayT
MQQQLFKTNSHPYSYGGSIRTKAHGRGQRPLSTRNPVHLVLKVEKGKLRSRSLRHPAHFALITKILQCYGKRFFVRVDQFSIQNDHIHLLIRAPKRCRFQYFFRVVPGQIAQQFQNRGWLTDTPGKLWKWRPFTRIVMGFVGLQIIRNYIQLNEKEATGKIRYQKQRLRGLSAEDWKKLWA